MTLWREVQLSDVAAVLKVAWLLLCLVLDLSSCHSCVSFVRELGRVARQTLLLPALHSSPLPPLLPLPPSLPSIPSPPSTAPCSHWR